MNTSEKRLIREALAAADYAKILALVSDPPKPAKVKRGALALFGINLSGVNPAHVPVHIDCARLATLLYDRPLLTV